MVVNLAFIVQNRKKGTMKEVFKCLSGVNNTKQSNPLVPAPVTGVLTPSSGSRSHEPPCEGVDEYEPSLCFPAFSL